MLFILHPSYVLHSALILLYLNYSSTLKRVSILFQIFPANNDRNSIVAHALRPRIYARYVKIKPNSWFRHISMRFELYGQRTGEKNQSKTAKM